MWVVKIGGSLAFSKTLPAWLEVLVRYGGGRVIIVPGGGKFANLVRRAQQYWQFADDTAHCMALSAMDQFGFMMAGIRRELTPVADVYHLRKALGETRVPIWLPSTMAVANNAIAASWEFSSDSLAAWLASHIEAHRLILVKSFNPYWVEVPVSDLSAQAIVDQHFVTMIGKAHFETWLLGDKGHEVMAKALCLGAAPGTRVVPRASQLGELSDVM